MCTVSFIPLSDGCILSSNRDEHISRLPALPPDFYRHQQKNLVYPKDTQAGGTWFIANQMGDAGILLNGAFEKHVSAPPYRKSRGFILPDIFQENSPLDALQQYDFTGIENCTLVLWIGLQLHECRWDGRDIHLQKLPSDQPHIWSSATLYNPQMTQERHAWFYEWLKKQTDITQEQIIAFHTHTEPQNQAYGIRISRNNGIQTSSLTSLAFHNGIGNLYYEDFAGNQQWIYPIVLNGNTHDFPETILS